jgi:hypothetical protein
MLTIPFQVKPGEFNVFVCLKDDNIARIKSYDPAEVSAEKFGLAGRKLNTVIIGYVTDEEEAEILRASIADIPKLLHKLSRGFAFKPKEGDNDIPYQRVKEN